MFHQAIVVIFELGIQRRVQRGFSMLELLVVLLIVGLMVSMAGLNFGSNSSRTLAASARTLFQQMRLAREEAILLDRQFGLLFEEVEPEGDSSSLEKFYRYRWLRYEEEQQQWVELRGQSGYVGAILPPSIDVDLTVDDRYYGLSLRKASVIEYSYEERLEDDDGEDVAAALPPQLMFLSSGEITEFSLNLSLREGLRAPVRISADASGGLQLEDEGI